MLTEEIDDDDGVSGAVLAALAVVGLVEEEGGHVGGEDGRVDHQHQDDPVPQGLNEKRGARTSRGETRQ